MTAALDVLVEEPRDQQYRQHTQRKIDVEHPAPTDVLSEKSADAWPNQPGHAPDRAKQAGDARALFQWKDVAQDGLGDRQHAARAETLEEPKGDQLLHGLRLAAQH